MADRRQASGRPRHTGSDRIWKEYSTNAGLPDRRLAVPNLPRMDQAHANDLPNWTNSQSPIHFYRD